MLYIARNLFNDMNYLESIDFGFNQIKAIDARTFSDLKRLKLILINNNHIKKLPAIVFQGNLLIHDYI
jgi:hypothetical protein